MQDKWTLLLDGRNLTSGQLVTQIMRNRGILDVDDFIHPNASHLLSTTSLYNIGKAGEIVRNNIKHNDKVLIYADVDADGCTSTAIIARYLRHYMSPDNVKVYVNSGKEHGIADDFDMDKNLDGIATVIVVDSIDDTPDKYLQILSRGVNLVILDHHVPTDAVLKVKDQICLVSSAVNYPNPSLSGAGVCWKFVSFLDECFGSNHTFASELVDLATVGIIADMSDLSLKSMENRYICDLGLKTPKNPAIKQIVGRYEFNAQSVSYSIAPLVNSANRLCRNQEAVDLFLSDDEKQIANILNQLTLCKEEQKAKVKELYATVKKQSASQLNRKCMFFCLEDASNFLGLVAGMALEEFQRPIIALSKSENSFDGSMRAIGVKDFRQMINDTGLAECNGHELAAGITIPKENLVPFCNKIEEILQNTEFVQEKVIDVRLTIPQVTSYLTNKLLEINRISGTGFPQVNVYIGDVDNYLIGDMASRKHLKIKAGDISFIKWNFTDWDDICAQKDKPISVVGTLSESFFGGKSSQQVILSDYRFQ